MGTAATPHKQAIKAYLTKSVCRIGTAAISNTLRKWTVSLESCASALPIAGNPRRKSPPPCNELKSLHREKGPSSNDSFDDQKISQGRKRGVRALVTNDLCLHNLSAPSVAVRAMSAPSMANARLLVTG